MLLAQHSTPVNRRPFDPRQVSIQMARAPLIVRNSSRRTNNNNHNNNHNNNNEYSFVVRTPNGPPMRLRMNLIAVDREPRQPRVQVRPIEYFRGEPAAADAAAVATGGEAARTRASRMRKKSTCNHALDRKFCSKCHIRRRHLNRWWLRQQYRQH